ncbi:transcriptional regulator [Rhodopila globiformis]|uniref:Transcriptional regulator n=2 Tax=Rhodopila globiformis TaxID=1071 RepID=A0A2S6NJW0_RHOGL|nr:transcriptional regulator [Rhodopila globiformis]
MKLANPAPLGLTGFALTTWMLSMVNAGWFGGAAVPMVLATAFAFGGTAQFAAGLMEMPRGNTFGFVAFCAYGAFWWAFALFVQFFHTGVPAQFVGWWLAAWGVFSLMMWFGSMAANRVLQMVFLALWITFFLLAASDLFGMANLKMYGGYGGLITAVLAFYLASAEVINETHGRTILPIGAPQAPQIQGLRQAA